MMIEIEDEWVVKVNLKLRAALGPLPIEDVKGFVEQMANRAVQILGEQNTPTADLVADYQEFMAEAMEPDDE